MVQDCPKCGLVNPPGAERCDCGYDFASRTMRESYLGTREAGVIHSPTTAEIVFCVLLPVVGIILGLVARSRGRRPAGRTMLLMSSVMLIFWFAVRVMIELSK